MPLYSHFRIIAWAGLLAGRLEKLDPERGVDTKGGGGFNPAQCPKINEGFSPWGNPTPQKRALGTNPNLLLCRARPR